MEMVETLERKFPKNLEVKVNSHVIRNVGKGKDS